MLEFVADQKVLLAAAVGAVGFLAYRQITASSSSAAGGAPSTPTTSKRKATEAAMSADETLALESLITLPRGSMQEVTIGEKNKILLIHSDDGKVYATSSKCTHYGAPLAKGVLCGTRVTCPWHAACFNVSSGDIEDAPGLDGLHTFPTRVGRDGSVYVTLPKEFPASHKRPLVKKPGLGKQQQKIVVIGSGPAGLVALQTLLENGFDGSLTMITNEKDLPYDRVKLSKTLSVEVPDILLRGADFFAANKVTTILGDAVVNVDPKGKQVTLQSGKKVGYTSLIVATGGTARTIPAPGHELANIFTLRYPQDAAGIIGACEQGASRVVVIGSSFIGMEAAAYLKQTKKMEQVIVVGMETVPFERVLGKELGKLMQDVHENKGIAFRMQRTVKSFLGADGKKVSGVILDNGEEIPADYVVIGAGIIPATGFLKSSGIPLERDGSIVVNASMQVPGFNDIYVVGDIARFPYWETKQTIRVEHWDVAQQHGRIAANHLTNKTPTEYNSVPFFWTQQLGVTIRYAGNAMKWDELVIHGSTKLEKRVAPIQGFYCLGDKVIAVVTVNKDPVAVAAAELIRIQKMPSVKDIKARGGDIDLVEHLRNVQSK